MPLNITAVVPDRFVPVRVTVIPLVPVAGKNDVIVGAGT
jgi:hypothetical protein